jgi:hypothetical protein
MSLLLLVGVHALAFRRSVYRNPALDSPAGLPRAAKIAACLSMALWVAILSNGRWIAYYERPEDKPPARTAADLPH